MYIFSLSIFALLLAIFNARYDSALGFKECNDIEFRSIWLQSRAMCDVSKAALAKEYKNAHPSTIELVMSLKPLSRKHWFTPHNQELYFNNKSL